MKRELKICILVSICTIFLLSSCQKAEDKCAQANSHLIFQVNETDFQLSSHLWDTHTEKYQYDDNMRLVSRSFDNSAFVTIYQYTSDSIIFEQGVQSYILDRNGKVIRQSDLFGSGQHRDYVYDVNGYLSYSFYYPYSWFYSEKDIYIWQGGNLIQKIDSTYADTIPTIENYTYYTDRPYQELDPTALNMGKPSANLIKTHITTRGDQLSNSSNDNYQSYTYQFEANGRVKSYSLTNISDSITFTPLYRCN